MIRDLRSVQLVRALVTICVNSELVFPLLRLNGESIFDAVELFSVFRFTAIGLLRSTHWLLLTILRGAFKQFVD